MRRWNRKKKKKKERTDLQTHTLSPLNRNWQGPLRREKIGAEGCCDEWVEENRSSDFRSGNQLIWRSWFISERKCQYWLKMSQRCKEASLHQEFLPAIFIPSVEKLDSDGFAGWIAPWGVWAGWWAIETFESIWLHALHKYIHQSHLIDCGYKKRIGVWFRVLLIYLLDFFPNLQSY